jgi:hypothetical protein
MPRKTLCRRLFAAVLSLQIGLAPIASLAGTNSQVQLPEVNEQELRHDRMLTYFGKLDVEVPPLTEFALGKPLTEERIPAVIDSPMLDADPFFMRSQSWGTNSQNSTCDQHMCFSKSQNGELQLSALTGDKVLLLKQKLTPILETDSYVILSADDESIFRAKLNEENQGEGIFFISKRSLVDGARNNVPVPIFFFPLPDDGWTGDQKGAFDLVATGQIVVHDKYGFGLPLEKSDFTYLEKVQRDNLVIAQMFSFMEGKVDARGVALPKPNSTLLFGTILSGQLPEVSGRRNALLKRLPDLQKFMRSLGNVFLPEAQAKNEEEEETTLDALHTGIEQRTKEMDLPYWRKWVAPTIAYGGIAAASTAIYMGHPIDWSTLISDKITDQLATVGKLLGVVAVSSVLMRYTVHKTKLNDKYRISANDSWLAWANKHHKALLDELTHGFYFSIAVLPQGIRHTLEFLKDKFIPSNHLVKKAWDETMGWQMRQNSSLAMNWKTFYLGALVFGWTDSVLVGVTMLLFTPFLMDQFGIGTATAAVTAGYVGSEILRNFLVYLQTGAHSYSAQMKFMHMQSAEKEARRQIEIQGEVDPNSAKGREMIHRMVEGEVEKRFKAVGLPGKDEFLYDPISALENASAKLGYRINDQHLTSEQIEMVKKHQFVLEKGHWGLIQPALKKALVAARKAQAGSPSEIGEQTIALLEWALNDRKSRKAVTGRVWDAFASKWGNEGFNEFVDRSMSEYLGSTQSPTWFGSVRAATRGAFRYLALDSTKQVRDMREVLYMMSTTGNARDFEGMLPDSWRRKAGSEEAALLGAELFHRAFYSLHSEQPELIMPTAELDAFYGPRARRVLSRLMDKREVLKDPFVYQVRYWQTLFRLKIKDKERSDLLNYKPKQSKGFAARQWAKAKKEALKVMAGDPIEDQVTREWLTLAERFQNESEAAVDSGKWFHSYRFKTLVAQKFAKTVGLTVNNVEDSDFVKQFVLKAAAETESKLNSEKERVHLQSLTVEDREFYEAQIFTANFINAYIAGTVASDKMSAGSPEYPGRFQAVRRMLIDVPGGKAVSKAVRFFEAMFRNEQTSYKPGFWSFLDRNIPILPDMYHNLIRSGRTMPYNITFSWLTSYYVWQIHIPYSIWVVYAVAGFWGSGLVEINNRFQRLLDKKPMGDVPSNLFYSFGHSMLTNLEIMVLQAYADTIQKGFDANVTEPMRSAYRTCAEILGGQQQAPAH